MFKFIIYLFMAVLDLCYCVDFPLVVAKELIESSS